MTATTTTPVTISERAARRIGEILGKETEGAMLRISVEGGGCSGFQYKFDIDRAKGGRLAELPIIALTANAFPDDIKQCREAGMSDFLAKPLRKPAMVAAMLKALGPAAPTVAAPSLAPSEDGASVAAEA
ncbi:MAG: hypothetical protein E6447_01600 [Bradyrhizobium sp.]|nr:hypothetical protein [Bradyrhizobium sp.]